MEGRQSYPYQPNPTGSGNDLPPIRTLFPDIPFSATHTQRSTPSTRDSTPAHSTRPRDSRSTPGRYSTDGAYAVINLDANTVYVSPNPIPNRPTHRQNQDASGRRYPCLECDQRFPTPSALETHMRSHTGARPFVCRYTNCRKAFTTHSNQKRHEETHTAGSSFEYPPSSSSGRRD